MLIFYGHIRDTFDLKILPTYQPTYLCFKSSIFLLQILLSLCPISYNNF